MTDIPPPRYRIVERRGRIVVTDTWAEGGRPVPSLPPTPGRGTGRGLVDRLRRRLVALACLGARDDGERPILSTNYHFDEKGPRAIVLSDAGARRLGNWLLGGVAIGTVSLIGLFFTPIAAMLALGGLGLGFTSANTTARPAITRWLDGLGEPPR